MASLLEIERRKTGVEMRVLGDSAFSNSRVCLQCVESRAQSEGIPIKQLRRIRNYSEIGLGMIMKATRRLYVRLPCDDDSMVNLLIEVAVRLANYRIRVAREGQLLGMNDKHFAEAEAALGFGR